MDELANADFLWNGIKQGGPVIVALHWLMLIGFGLAIVLSIRRAGSLQAFACTLLPFAFGAFATCFGVLSFTVIIPELSNSMYEGDPLRVIPLIQRPFFIGNALSLIALVNYFFTRAYYCRRAADF